SRSSGTPFAVPAGSPATGTPLTVTRRSVIGRLSERAVALMRRASFSTTRPSGSGSATSRGGGRIAATPGGRRGRGPSRPPPGGGPGEGFLEVAVLQVLGHHVRAVELALELGGRVVGGGARGPLVHVPADVAVAVQAGGVVALGDPGHPLAVGGDEDGQ